MEYHECESLCSCRTLSKINLQIWCQCNILLFNGFNFSLPLSHSKYEVGLGGRVKTVYTAKVYWPWKIIANFGPSLFLLQSECLQLDLWRWGTICEKCKNLTLNHGFFWSLVKLLNFWVLDWRGYRSKWKLGHVPGLVSLRYSALLDILLHVRGNDSLHLKIFINIPSWVFWSF